MVDDAFPLDENLAAVDFSQAEQGGYEFGLAVSGYAGDSDDFSPGDMKRDSIQDWFHA